MTINAYRPKQSAPYSTARCRQAAYNADGYEPRHAGGLDTAPVHKVTPVTYSGHGIHHGTWPKGVTR